MKKANTVSFSTNAHFFHYSNPILGSRQLQDEWTQHKKLLSAVVYIISLVLNGNVWKSNKYFSKMLFPVMPPIVTGCKKRESHI